MAVRRILCFAGALLLGSGEAVAEALCDAKSAPPCSGSCPNATWWKSYKAWCEACGGSTFQDSSGGGCKPGPDWGRKGGDAAASGNPSLDQAYANAMSAARTGTQAAQATTLYLGAAVLTEAMRAPTPEEQAAAEAQRQAELEAARQRQAEADRRNVALLSEMQGVESSSELQMLGGESDGDTEGIMGKRRKHEVRNPPPAVRLQPHAVDKAAGAGEGSADGSSGPGDASGSQVASGGAVATGTGAKSEPASHAQGMVDGRACRQRSPGTFCSGQSGDVLTRCLRFYNEGFDAGRADLDRELAMKGAAAGLADKGHSPLSHEEARGPCGSAFTQAYNRANR